MVTGRHPAVILFSILERDGTLLGDRGSRLSFHGCKGIGLDSTDILLPRGNQDIIIGDECLPADLQLYGQRSLHGETSVGEQLYFFPSER